MALFASIGQFHGHAMVKEQSETLDKSSEVERFASGGIGDVGCVFSYQLNRDWDIFIQSLYQGKFGVKTETIFSEPSADVELSITGALVQIGTSLKTLMKLFISCGETSGDIYAARLIKALNNSSELELSGNGGEHMEREGCHFAI